MSAMMIAGIEIHQDPDGRFSLNDFHKAAGGEDRHRPSRWVENQQAQDLIEEIGKAGIPALRVVKGGRTPGTYACKELIYAYAMWVSPAFSLHVIRTFDSAAANDAAIPQEQRLPVAADNFDAAKRIAEGLGLEGNQALLSATTMVRAAIGIDLMEMSGVKFLINATQELNYTPTELGAKFGISAAGMNKLLAQCGLQHHVTYKPGKKRWEITPEGKRYAVITDTSKRSGDGKPIQQILWKESVITPLHSLAEKLNAELVGVVCGGLTQ